MQENLNLENNHKRQKATQGSIIQIQARGYYYYAQILSHGYCVFFDYQSVSPIDNISRLLDCPELFTICVYSDVISSGSWPKIGKLKIREDCQPLRMQYIYHNYEPYAFEIYNPNTGEIRPSTKEECRGLECCAVWDKHHIEDRLSDYYEGKPCLWLEDHYRLFSQ